MKLENYLLKYFGHNQFRPSQKEIISSVLNQTDTFALLPTGGGKSVCFQLPGLILGGTTLVVSPLISLMEDQTKHLLDKNIKAVFINSTVQKLELHKIYLLIKKGYYSFLYVTPERLNNVEFLQICKNISLPLVAIDEAHCISEWGQSFRPSYRSITSFIKKLKVRPIILALTATATPKVQSDIISNLNLNNPAIFKQSFQRTNLKLHVMTCRNYQEQLIYTLNCVQKNTKSTIIYTATHDKTIYWTQFLNYLSNNYIAMAYHGGLSNDRKKLVQKSFFDNKIKIVVATSAFGMGIDKSDISLVIHLDPALSLEEYYQEVGRGGRDGEPADCVLITQPKSAILLNSLIEKSLDTKNSYLKLKRMYQFIETKKCRMKFILNYFGEKTTRCGNCDNCLKGTINLPIDPKNFYQLKEQIYKSCNQKYSNSFFMTPAEIILLNMMKPQNKSDFLKIPGIGKGWVENWYPTIQPHLNNIYGLK